ncbi:MAG: 1-deoxy-D-xylulose-5-phosphate synthase [Odoribacteraceae bacterium]|jgi:1-deoxy-D-xylulose-5-phosphate synthase|nr:1-deoxy-D-xylulose-5-phosphate synthase [Odoribacteraceae bacterium]
MERLLDKINSPADLKQLPEGDLERLCDELREKIIDECSEHPGHFGASLGVVELTVALHYVFDTPRDNLIWDVGHQAYAHKILTGRRDTFHTNRQYNGISGFPRRDESEYDSFGTGHSSTSISAALGMAVAAKMDGEDNRLSVAVIGDGSMTGGLAFEGLNNAGINNANLLVILNDNNMAIDPNVGGMNEYLLDIATSRAYNKIKEEVWHVLGRVNKISPGARNFIQKIDNSIKSLVMKQGNLFEALGLRYFGPVDGHDVVHLVKVLRDLKAIKGPKLLHCLTVKGKGFKQAEIDQTVWHAPGKFNKDTGEILHDERSNTPPRYQDVFGYTLLDLARANPKIVGITPAMPTGCSLNIMMREMPGRCFDVGIAEQHAVTFSAGMAARGYIPFCNIYSTFMQRAYDQVIHDVALQRLHVVFCLDRGGLVGADGPTHHGAFDLAYFRGVPNLTIAAPLDESELRNMMYTAQLPGQGPFSIRYPRGNGTTVDWRTPCVALEVGKGRRLVAGDEVAILSIGTIGGEALKAVRRCPAGSVALYDMRFLKPLDEELLHEVFRRFTRVMTVEEGTVVGGLGSAVLEFMSDHGYSAAVTRAGIPDRFVGHGTREQLLRECRLDADALYRRLCDLIVRR